MPSLAVFCIRALVNACEELHVLCLRRLYFPKAKKKQPGKRRLLDMAFLRALIKGWGTMNFPACSIDPRLWATIIQVYRAPPPPEFLPSYPIRLILLSSIKYRRHSTSHWLLEKMRVSNKAIDLLSKTLLLDDEGQMDGPWRLRILCLRACSRIDKHVFHLLKRLPLLYVVGAVLFSSVSIST